MEGSATFDRVHTQPLRRKDAHACARGSHHIGHASFELDVHTYINVSMRSGLVLVRGGHRCTKTRWSSAHYLLFCSTYSSWAAAWIKLGRCESVAVEYGSFTAVRG